MVLTRTRIAGALAGIVALVAALLPGIAAADVPSEQVPAGLKAAIEQYIEGQGHEYAGLGRDVNAGNPAEHVGEYVAFVQSIEHEIAEVTYGPVLSDTIDQVNFQLVNGQWQLLTGSPTPITNTPVAGTPTSTTSTGTPRPPVTGDAGPSHAGDRDSLVILGVGVAVAIGLAAAGTVGMRKR